MSFWKSYTRVFLGLLLGIFFSVSAVAQVQSPEEWAEKNNAFTKDYVAINEELANNRVPVKLEKKDLQIAGLSREAKELYECAEGGDEVSQLNVAKNYLYAKNGFPRDERQAFYWLYKLANRGNDFAKHLVADMLASGSGVSKNIPEAMYWYGQISKYSLESMLKLGDYFYTGIGCRQNFDYAYALYIRASEKSNLELNDKVRVNLRFGMFFMEGKGCPVNGEHSIELFKEIVDARDKIDKTGNLVSVALSYYCLGRCYYEGIGCLRNTILARRYFREGKKLVPDLNNFYLRLLNEDDLEKLLFREMIPYADKILEDEYQLGN